MGLKGTPIIGSIRNLHRRIIEDDIDRGSVCFNLGDKANSVVFDNSKLKRLVPEFVATTRLDQGIKQTVQYILAHPELQLEDPEFDAWCDKVIDAMDRAVKAVIE